MSVPAFLSARYDLVVQRFQLRFPDRTPPDFPNTNDPNAVVAVIDEMLAALQNREPTRVRIGEPWVSSKHADDTEG